MFSSRKSPSGMPAGCSRAMDMNGTEAVPFMSFDGDVTVQSDQASADSHPATACSRSFARIGRGTPVFWRMR